MKLTSFALGYAITSSWLLAESRAAAISLDKAESRKRASAPQVAISGLGTFQGLTSSGVDAFRGIPFALPPVGDLRLRTPQPFNKTLSGIQDATVGKLDCPQQVTGNYALPAAIAAALGEAQKFLLPVSQISEDCLYLNVFRPAGVAQGANLPVLFWIYGGGFEFGGISTYDPTSLVQQSVAMGQPVIFVAANYRVSGFGFMPGKQIQDQQVGNLGLRDQRLALQWVNTNVHYFGGDATKVTIWGESAGAISVGFHLLYNGGVNENLFRGFIAESGSIIPVGDLTYGQGYYDNVVSRCGCSGASDQVQCLRKVDFETFYQAVNSNPSILTNYRTLSLAYLPRVDGDVIKELPSNQALSGNFIKVPGITGDNTDEGTIFPFTALNVTSDSQFADYVKGYFPLATDAVVQQLTNAYPADITQGSPYNTGMLYALTPQIKRISSILGDLVFQAPRRVYLSLATSNKVPVWTYRFNHVWVAQLGSFHASELPSVFGTLSDTTSKQMQSLWISFANNLDPNKHSQPSLNIPYWPQYTTGNKSQILFDVQDTTMSSDTYRQSAIQTIINNINSLVV